GLARRPFPSISLSWHRPCASFHIHSHRAGDPPSRFRWPRGLSLVFPVDELDPFRHLRLPPVAEAHYRYRCLVRKGDPRPAESLSDSAANRKLRRNWTTKTWHRPSLQRVCRCQLLGGAEFSRARSSSFCGERRIRFAGPRELPKT